MPAETSKRRMERRTVHSKDHAQVTLHAHNHDIKTSLYDLSPIGAGLFYENATADDVKTFKSGQVVRISFDNEDPNGRRTAQAVICHISHIEKKSKQGLLIGIRFLAESAHHDLHSPDKAEQDEMRELPELFRPLAYAEDQLFYGEFLHFQVLAYSVTDVLLRTSKSNKGLNPGHRLFLRVMLPDHVDGGSVIRFTEVVNPSLDEKTYLIRAKWEKPSKTFLEALAEFLFLACPGISVKALVKENWPAMALRRALRFRYASSEDEFIQVLDLRLMGAHSDGRWLDTQDSRKMLDSFDIHSRHIMCVAGERLVGTARLVFNDGEHLRAEHTGYGVKLPDRLWKGGFVEVSRLCTHPDYRGADVFLFMLQHLGRIVLTSGNAYMLTNCVDSLVPIYERFGAKNIGLRFDSPFMQGHKLNLLVFDCKKICAGFGINPIYYTLGFKNMTEHLERQGLVEFSGMENAVRNLIGLMAPLVHKMEKKKRGKKIQQPRAGKQSRKPRVA